jgi:hypothetical protein
MRNRARESTLCSALVVVVVAVAVRVSLKEITIGSE